jgi:hypothetical protein
MRCRQVLVQARRTRGDHPGSACNSRDHAGHDVQGAAPTALHRLICCHRGLLQVGPGIFVLEQDWISRLTTGYGVPDVTATCAKQRALHCIPGRFFGPYVEYGEREKTIDLFDSFHTPRSHYRVLHYRMNDRVLHYRTIVCCIIERLMVFFLMHYERSCVALSKDIAPGPAVPASQRITCTRREFFGNDSLAS